MKSDVYNIDCMEYMHGIPDKAIDLVIADPPYGIGASKPAKKPNYRRQKNGTYLPVKLNDYGKKDWDSTSISPEFFEELKRISRHQIIFGANYFGLQGGMMQGVYCGSDVGRALVQQGNKAQNEKRIHPTQKPVALYAWLLTNYAQPGWCIFDPMMGSQSSRIAAHKLGFDYVGCERDKEYFDKGCERYDTECLNLIKTPSGRIVEQLSLFEE